MNQSDTPHDSQNSLDNILKELEQRFGLEEDKNHKLHWNKKLRKFVKNVSQTQILGGLTLVLLLVGAITGTYLGGQNAENRQRASVAYQTCGAGSVGNCPIGVSAGSGCNISGFPGTCQNSETDPACTCVLDSSPTFTPVCLGLGIACANQAGQDPCCAPASCEIVGPNNATKCVLPATGIPTNTPTKTFTPGGPTITPIPTATNTPIVIGPTNTPVVPTNTPIQVTSIPATNTPVKTNTPGPTTIPSATPTPGGNTCSFLVTGDNIADSYTPAYGTSMYNYVKAAAPNTTSTLDTVLSASGTTLKSMYSGIFYISGTAGRIVTDATKLDEYLNAKGNLLILADDVTSDTYTNQYLAKYGISIVNGNGTVAVAAVNQTTVIDPVNAGLGRMYLTTSGYARSVANANVISAKCQYTLTLNDLNTCLWMQVDLVSGGRINVVTSFGAFGGGSSFMGANGAASIAPIVTQLTTSLTKNYCTKDTATPTPTPTPLIGPTCNSIAMSYGGNTPNRPVQPGDNLVFTCGTIANATRYEFRIFQNGSLFATINPSANGASISEPFPMNQLGTFQAQCRGCADITAASCQAWEPL